MRRAAAKPPVDAAPALLVADIGGTFARFAIVQGGGLSSRILTRARSSADDLSSLCRQAMRDLDQPVAGAAIAVAAPVSEGRARMTNAAWEVDEAALAGDLSLDQVVLLNDFAALALSLPALAVGDVLALPPGADRAVAPVAANAPRVVFGPGTGLGVAALLHHGGHPLVLASEGGHIGFAPATRFEQRVLDHAATRFERVSWERLLSGPGLELIDQVSCREFGLSDEVRTATQIVDAARQGSCAAAAHSVAAFAGLLGSFGGDLALMFRATGGVVVGGGMALRIAPLIALPGLRQRFSQKGRFAAWLEDLPLSILLTPNAALIGAARAFAERFPA